MLSSWHHLNLFVWDIQMFFVLRFVASLLLEDAAVLIEAVKN